MAKDRKRLYGPEIGLAQNLPLQAYFAQKSSGILTLIRVISSIMMADFEWDPAKAAANIRKHGVSFEQAALAFGTSFRSSGSTRERVTEKSALSFGTSQGQILAVVYTEREERIRIISARRATKDEQDRYFRENGR